MLTSQDYFDIRKNFMSQYPTNISKSALLTAMQDIDTWIELNQTAFNLSLNVEARTKLTATQKALLFSIIAIRRVNG